MPLSINIKTDKLKRFFIEQKAAAEKRGSLTARSIKDIDLVAPLQQKVTRSPTDRLGQYIAPPEQAIPSRSHRNDPPFSPRYDARETQ